MPLSSVLDLAMPHDNVSPKLFALSRKIMKSLAMLAWSFCRSRGISRTHGALSGKDTVPAHVSHQGEIMLLSCGSIAGGRAGQVLTVASLWFSSPSGGGASPPKLNHVGKVVLIHWQWHSHLLFRLLESVWEQAGQFSESVAMPRLLA